MKKFLPKYRDKKIAHIPNKENYQELYDESINNPDKFWSEQATRLTWFNKWNKVKNVNFNKGKINWFEGGELNACFNCIDRHIDSGDGDKVALIWEGNNPGQCKKYTYNDLLIEVSKCANMLLKNGIEKGDRVCIYMQMVPELAISMLACARIGAVHSIVFGAFSSDSLRDRINDSKCKMVITQDWGVRGSNTKIEMKNKVDIALKDTPSIHTVIVVKRTGSNIVMEEERDYWWHEEILAVQEDCPAEPMDAEDPLFILYTSGSTGKPKGILHTTGGYLLYTSITHEMIFDYQENDIYWCTADIGWITGHSYIIYGPLSNCATTLMYEGVPNHPDFSRYWQIIDKYKVNIFYTAPTALRALMREGNSYLNSTKRSTLKLLGTVGEPIKEPEWNWYFNNIGNGNCPIVDTWWQTETGGILISPFPAFSELKPGSAVIPFFGIEPVLLDEEGNEQIGNPASGYLAIKGGWPGQMRSIYGDSQRFFDTYFSKFKNYYFTGDGAKRDVDGCYWLTGRVDDVLNVSGHRLGTAEIEGAIGSHKSVAEAAVVGYNHEVKGQGIYAFVSLMTGINPEKSIIIEIKETVSKLIGAHAKPDKIQFSAALPKTRSGKIMRRILRKIAEGEFNQLGDTTTLSDPDIVKKLVQGKV